MPTKDDQRSQRFSRVSMPSGNEAQRQFIFLSRGNSVSNIPWWIITLMAFMILFLLFFIMQFVYGNDFISQPSKLTKLTK